MNWKTGKPATLFDSISSRLLKLDEAKVDELLVLAREDDPMLGKELEQVNRPTCRNFWLGWSELTYPATEKMWRLLEKDWRRTDPMVRWKLLDKVLHLGDVDRAMWLIDAGAPTETISLRGIQLLGPLAKLAYGDYKQLNRKQISTLTEKILLRDDVWDFNPAGIKYKEVAEVFLKYAPPPEDYHAWKERMIWGPDNIVGGEVEILFTDGDPECAILFLEAGYPSNHVDLLARACINKRDRLAAALLDWHGFNPGDIQREPTCWDAGTAPVVPRSFWHFLAHGWGEQARAIKSNGWATTPHWPEESIIDRLMNCCWLDINAKDPHGNTVLDVASSYSKYGTHPIMEIWARHRKRALETIAGDLLENKPPTKPFM